MRQVHRRLSLNRVIGKATVIVDEAAAAKFKEQEYYRWSFANEPEWEEYR